MTAVERPTYDLKGRRAIVTGASQGLGAAIALELARCGADVALTARNATKLHALAADIIARHGTRAITVPCDLRAPEAASRVLDAALVAYGGVDILVNNAGATKRGDFLTLTDDDFIDGFALKFHGAVRLTKAAWPHLKSDTSRGKVGGSIVNIVGIGSNTPAMDFTIGGPVNSALINFTKAIADRGLADGIRVNAINPGHIVTDRFRHRIEAAAKQDDISFDAAKERARVELGIQRFGQPEEIAALAAFLCSADSAYIHGAKIDIDGGASKGI
jgi:3-oxoacyl-[acyl-carrier protein] reductase